MKKCIMGFVIGFAAFAQATVIIEGKYEFEIGALLSDSSGSLDLLAADASQGTTGAKVGTGYLQAGGNNSIVYNAASAVFGHIDTSNFAIGTWVRTADKSVTGTALALGGYAVDGLNLGVNSSGEWAAAYDNQFANGITSPVGSTVAVQENTWTHLAVICDGGQSTFYVNGVAQGASSGYASPNLDYMHFAASPPERVFSGDFDDMYVLSFDDAATTRDILTTMGIPEPVSLGLLGMAGALLLLFRRFIHSRQSITV